MRCDILIKYGPLFSSGELDESDRKKFMDHTESCAECRAYLHNEQELMQYLAKSRISVPEELNRQILAQVKKENRLGGIFSKRLVYTLSVAAATALLLFINTQLINQPVQSTEWQSDSNITALQEVADMEEQISLLDMDYSQNGTEISEDYYQSEENQTLINALDDFE